MTDRYAPADTKARPLVSVIIVTYRHEAFIRQAVDSVLSQRTAFPIEILISEDCSPDRTRDIVLDLQRRHPDTIRLFLSERNLNDNTVTARAWAAARSRYIATLDGDDFWTDPLKLQKQVDFLERHPDVFISGHAVAVVDERGQQLKANKFDVYEDRYLSRQDLVAGYAFPFVSVVFRNNGRIPPHELFNTVGANGDSLMFAFFANFGGGYMSREVMAAYRLHAGGAWSTMDARRATDHRNRLFWTIPKVLSRSLRSIAYAKFLAHALLEDYRWSRKLRQIPYAATMTLLSLTPSAAIYLLRRLIGRSYRKS